MFNKAFIALALIFAVTCADGPLFDISKFLNDSNDDGVPITIGLCDGEKETRFQYLKSSLKPDKVIKGADIQIKVQGVALQELVVKNLHLVTNYNDGEIFVDNKAQGMKPLEEGKKYTYDYTASIPTFTPSGSWDIYLRLQDDKDQEIHCLKAHFDMP